MRIYLRSLSVLGTILLFFWTYSISQDSKPIVSISSISVDTIDQEVAIVYDLDDAESDSLEVWLNISANGGESYSVLVDSVSGDVGFPVIKGTGKELVWHYNPEELPADTDFLARVVASDRVTISIEDLVAQVDSNRLKEDMEYLTSGIRHRLTNLAHLNGVRDSLQGFFLQHGLQTEIQPFNSNGYTAGNVLGRLPGWKNDATTYIVDGHFDSVNNSPGADDNASAVAGMMEVLRILAPYDFNHSLRFIGFDQEEAGLVGSIRYVSDGIKEYENIEGVLNLEMIGYTCVESDCQSLPFGFELVFPDAADSVAALDNQGIFLTNVGNTNSTPLMDTYSSCAFEYVPELIVISIAAPGNGQLTPDLTRSDHAPFWFDNIQALMLTDGSEFRNPNYHLPSDVMETLDFDFMTKVVKATVATAAKLAEPIHAGQDVSEVFDLGVITSWKQEDAYSGFRLEQNFPNPFHPTTRIRYYLPQQENIQLVVYDVNGKEVARLFTGSQAEGWHQVVWNSEETASPDGLYLMRLTATGYPGSGLTRKMMKFKHHH